MERDHLFEEQWCPIAGYEGLYEVSNYGEVARVNRSCRKLLRQSLDKKGYAKVGLSKNSRMHSFRVHRLVAEHFVANPNRYVEVNHIDENKLNNMAWNLEWCTRKHNVNHGTRTEKQRAKISKPVIGVCGEITRFFKSQTEAAKFMGFSSTSRISACCKGKRRSAGNYVWRYANE